MTPATQGAVGTEGERTPSQTTVASETVTQPQTVSMEDFKKLEAKLQSERDKAANEAKVAREETRRAQERLAEIEIQRKRTTLLERGMDETEADSFVSSEVQELRSLRIERDIRELAASVNEEFQAKGIELADSDVSKIPMVEIVQLGPKGFRERLRSIAQERYITKRERELNDLEAKMVKGTLAERREAGADKQATTEVETQSAPSLQAAYEKAKIGLYGDKLAKLRMEYREKGLTI